MNQLAASATDAFYHWERRCRGWTVFEKPVCLEPEFAPFTYSPPQTTRDEGRRTLFDGIRKLFTKDPIQQAQTASEPEAYLYVPHESLCVLLLHRMPFDIDREREVQLMSVLIQSKLPITFEYVLTKNALHFQMVVYESYVDRVTELLALYFPDIALTRTVTFPCELADTSGILDFGLSEECMIPLAPLQSKSPDTLLGFFSLSLHLQPDECIVLQCTCASLQNAWSSALHDAVTLSDGSSFFSDAAQFPKLVSQKIADPLCAVSYRAIVSTASRERTRWCSEHVATTLSRSPGADHNGIFALSNDGISLAQHIQCAYTRTSLRTGMILSVKEVQSLIHLPSHDQGVQQLFGEHGASHPLPEENTRGRYTIGVNACEGVSARVCMSDQERLKHMHIVGVTGSGKSTLMISLAYQDAVRGNGFALVDPHGDLVDDILAILPKERHDDVIIIDPSHEEYIVGFNVLLAHNEFERLFITEELVSILRSHSSSWGDQMEQVLSHAIHVFVERDEGGSLYDLRLFLSDAKYRASLLDSIVDPLTKRFWKEEFDATHKRSITPLITRLDSFIRPKVIRAMMTERQGLNFSTLLAEKKIVLLKLGHGVIGEQNAFLLGTLFVSKLYQAALARQRLFTEDRHPFYLYIDEFHHFISRGLLGILTGARKYGLGLVVAHQHLEQLTGNKELSATLLANAYTQICFRLGHNDAMTIAKGYTHFEESDFLKLPVGTAIARIGGAHRDFNLSCDDLTDIDRISEAERQELVSQSLMRYGHIPSSQVTPVEAPQPEVVPIEDIPKPEESIAQQSIESVSMETPGVSNIEEARDAFLLRETRAKELRLHESIKARVVAHAHSFGWKADIEAPVEDGRIDVLLSNGDILVGVEVSTTNTVEYEIHNIAKCLKHGCGFVICISPSSAKLKGITASLDESMISKVICIKPEGFVDWLTAQSNKTPEENVVRGYRVKVRYET